MPNEVTMREFSYRHSVSKGMLSHLLGKAGKEVQACITVFCGE